MSTPNTWSKTIESDLIALAKSGERKAAGELFERHYKTSLNLARRILQSEADSEDAVQSAYCSALQHLGTYRGEASFATWINRIVINQCFACLRSPWRQRRLSHGGGEQPDILYNLLSPAPSPETLAWRREVAGSIDVALFHLPPNLRSVFGTYIDTGMSAAEVASSMGLSLAATKTRIHRARQAMRLSLKRTWPAYKEGRHSRRGPGESHGIKPPYGVIAKPTERGISFSPDLGLLLGC
jgi:RNA polymerase sigma-70 factor, ECF subfamily